MCLLMHRLRIVLFFRKVMFRTQDIKFLFFNHSMICQNCDVIMSISTWDRVHFSIYLLNHNSLGHQTWPTDRYKQGTTIFSNLLNNLEDVGYVPGPFQFSNLLQLVNNQLCQDPSVSLSRKGEEGAIKMVNVIY